MQRETRGKTKPRRLQLWLSWFRQTFHQSNTLRDRSIVDLGYGEKPYSTFELFEEAQRWFPSISLIGLETAEHRHLQAQSLNHPKIQFILGSADAIASCTPRPYLIRALNVLRQYPPRHVALIREDWLQKCPDDLILTEGSTDRDGHVLGMWVVGKQRKARLVLGVSGERGFAPNQVVAALPNDLRWQHTRPEWVSTLLDRWTAAWVLTDSRRPALERFYASIEGLRREHPSWVEDDNGLWKAGLVAFLPDNIMADTTG